jgi:hypothetical protein
VKGQIREEGEAMPNRLFLALTLWGWWSASGLALTAEDLNPEREWRVQDISISGNAAFSERELLTVLRTTKGRPGACFESTKK